MEEKSFVRILILNRPQKLNVLSYTMVCHFNFTFYLQECLDQICGICFILVSNATRGDIKGPGKKSMSTLWALVTKQREDKLIINFTPFILCSWKEL